MGQRHARRARGEHSRLWSLHFVRRVRRVWRRAGGAGQRGERASQHRARRAQLGVVLERELVQQRLAARGEADEHLAAVGLAAAAANQPLGFGAIHQLDGAVVLEVQTLGELADGRLLPGGVAADGEQELVLLGLDPGGAGGLLAEVDEAADLVAQLGERAVLVGTQVGLKRLHAEDYIVSRYICRGDGGPGRRWGQVSSSRRRCKRSSAESPPPRRWSAA